MVKALCYIKASLYNGSLAQGNQLHRARRRASLPARSYTRLVGSTNWVGLWRDWGGE